MIEFTISARIMENERQKIEWITRDTKTKERFGDFVIVDAGWDTTKTMLPLLINQMIRTIDDA